MLECQRGLACFWCGQLIYLAKSWDGNGKVDMAPATPAIRHSPPMIAMSHTAFASSSCQAWSRRASSIPAWSHRPPCLSLELLTSELPLSQLAFAEPPHPSFGSLTSPRPIPLRA